MDTPSFIELASGLVAESRPAWAASRAPPSPVASAPPKPRAAPLTCSSSTPVVVSARVESERPGATTSGVQTSTEAHSSKGWKPMAVMTPRTSRGLSKIMDQPGWVTS